MKNFWKYVIGALCVACCAVPILLIASVGTFGLSFFTTRIEIIVIAGVSLATVFFFHFKKKKHVHSNTCDIDCKCGETKNTH
jgi:heme/copper-type cytochrome/quinol oxidase subunit 4